MRSNNGKRTKTTSSKRTPKKYAKKGTKFEHVTAPDMDCSSNANGCNDPSWYTANRQLVLDAGSFSFNTPAGSLLRGTYPHGRDKSFAGVCALTTMSTPGISTDPFSPINIAARSMYDAVNYKNSRNFTYDAPDLMVYAFSVASAYSYWSWMQRTYGIMNTYSQINRYIPDALVKATGVDSDDIRLNMAQFRYYINLFARKINVLAVPSGMPFFERAMWLYSNIYQDSNNLKAALYITKPYGFYVFNESVKTGSAAQMKPLPKRALKLSDIIAYGNTLSEALLSSQDINNMSSDVLKAYESNVVALPDTPSDYGVIPVYNEAVLNQIHNARVLGDFVIDAPSTDGQGNVSLGSSGNLVQDATGGYLEYSLELSSNSNFAKLTSTNLLLDTGIENPTPDDVFEMTRLMAVTDHKTGNMMSCGADVILNINMYRITDEHEDGVATLTTSGEAALYYFMANANAGEICIAAVELMDYLTKFDWAPFFYVVNVEQRGDSKILGDVYNYTTISYESLRKLHEAAMLSMFTLPNTLGSK